MLINKNLVFIFFSPQDDVRPLIKLFAAQAHDISLMLRIRYRYITGSRISVVYRTVTHRDSEVLIFKWMPCITKRG